MINVSYDTFVTHNYHVVHIGYINEVYTSNQLLFLSLKDVKFIYIAGFVTEEEANKERIYRDMAKDFE